MAIKANLDGLMNARHAARSGRIDRGTSDSSAVGRGKVQSHKFAGIDDSRAETDAAHYVHPIVNGTQVNEKWVNDAISASKGNDELIAHLQDIQDEIQRSKSDGLMRHPSHYGRTLILANVGETFSASRTSMEVPKDMPAAVNGKPVVYKWKESVPADRTIIDNNGREHFYPKERLAKAVETFSRAIKKGFVAPLPEVHRKVGTPITGKNYGYMVGAKQDTETGNAFTLCQLFEDTLPEAMSKYSSICINPSYTDDTGEVFEDLFDHNAIVPDPRINGLGEFIPALAASRDNSYASQIDVAQFSNGVDMDLATIKATLGEAAVKGLDDKQVLTLINDRLKTLPVTEQALAASREDVKRITTEKTTLEASRGIPAGPSDGERTGYAYGIKAKAGEIDPAKSGIGQPTIDAVAALLIKDGKATPMAMSRGDGETDPLGVKLLDILKANVVPPKHGSETQPTAFNRNADNTEWDAQEAAGKKQGESGLPAKT